MCASHPSKPLHCSTAALQACDWRGWVTLLPSAAAGGPLQHMQHCSGTRSQVAGRHAPNAILELHYSYIVAVIELHYIYFSYIRAPDSAPCAERRSIAQLQLQCV